MGDPPPDLIDSLSEDLLARFGTLPLLDPYDIYQRLMDYWEEVMQDDAYLIASNGWTEASRPRLLVATGKAAEGSTRSDRQTPQVQGGPGGLRRCWLRATSSQTKPPSTRSRLNTKPSQPSAVTLWKTHNGEEGFITAALSRRGKADARERQRATQGHPHRCRERRRSAGFSSSVSF